MGTRDGLLAMDIREIRSELEPLSFRSVLVGGLFVYSMYLIYKASTHKLEERIEKLERRIGSR